MISDDELLDLTARENGVSVDDIRSKERDPRLTLVRMQVARRLRGRGYSHSAIGKRINKDRWTVEYYLEGGGKKVQA